MVKTDFFWTDVQQASDRLSRTVVCYDGQPYYVESVEPHDDGIPRGRMRPCADEQKKSERKMLNSPKFKRFRELPHLGWMNYAKDPRVGSLFLQRRTVAGGRVHGLSNGNVIVSNLDFGDGVIPRERSGNYNFSHVIFDKGFVDSHNYQYPSLDKILANIKEGTSIAFSPMFCVVRATDGLRWMYRNLERIGIFTGVDTLNLISKYAYLREEIMADKAFTLNNLREF